MHDRRWLLLCGLVALLPLAGCTGPDEAEATTPSVPPTFRPPAGFVLEGPTITPLDGAARPLREDDGAWIRYTLRQPEAATEAGTAFVNLLLGGTVVEVEAITLAPGASKAFEHKIDAVRGMGRLDVEVRAASANGRASADVLDWPRPGEALAFGDHFQTTVDGWTRNETPPETVVRVSLTRGAQPFTELRSYLLCLDPEGKPARAGNARPQLQPDANGTEALELRFPLCAGETYGVEIKADVASGSLMGRVLFVPKGWTPPAPP